MIELRHLRKEYENVTPLEDVNVTINAGDVISVIGPSGTGKSTLLRCINLLEKPTSGDIIVDGENITDGSCDINEVRKKMGMVFQSFNLFGHLTVIENIMNPQISLLGKSRQEAYDKAIELLSTVGLASKVLSYPDELSGGQQQRIAIARTLAMNPEIILFDEPTSALDPSMIGEVQSVIRMLAKTGVTMMIVTHEMDFARKISNRIFFMDEGGIYEEGTPKQIFDRPRKEKTRKFIYRMSSLSYKVDTPDYDFDIIRDELQSYSEKLLIELERVSKLTMALEELCINTLLQNSGQPDFKINIDYSEKSDVLSLIIRYNGEFFEPKDSDNELFLSILNEKTTELAEEDIDAETSGYEHLIYMKFRWED